MSDPDAVRDRALRRLSHGVERAVLTVEGQQVIVFARDGGLRTLCTCEREDCPHASRAVAWVAGESLSVAPEARVRSSSPPPPSVGLQSEARAELAAALDDVLLAVTRTGVAAGGGPSVRDTLKRLAERAPKPMPLGLRRWVGRLEVSLAQQELGTVARLLHGAGRFADDLRGDRPDAEQRAREVAWLGPPADDGSHRSRLTDRTFVEVGRERITGVSRRSLERRYLVDLQSFEILREERDADEVASLGPCPRALQVGLAEVELGGAPRRVRLLQYAVVPEIGAAHWASLSDMAVRTVRDVAAAYVQAQQAYPGVAEPFVLFAPESVAAPPLSEPVDMNGECLPLARAENAAFAEVIRRAAASREVLWLGGRVTDTGGTLMLRPISLAYRVSEGAEPRLMRVA